MITKNPQIIQGINDIAAAITAWPRRFAPVPRFQAFGHLAGHDLRSAISVRVQQCPRPHARSVEAARHLRRRRLGSRNGCWRACRKRRSGCKTPGTAQWPLGLQHPVADELRRWNARSTRRSRSSSICKGARAQLQTQFIRAAKMTAPIEEEDIGGMRTGAGLRDLIEGPGLERLSKATRAVHQAQDRRLPRRKSCWQMPRATCSRMDPEQVVVLRRENSRA